MGEFPETLYVVKTDYGYRCVQSLSELGANQGEKVAIFTYKETAGTLAVVVREDSERAG